MKSKYIEHMRMSCVFSFCLVLLLASPAMAGEEGGLAQVETLSLGAGLILPGASDYEGKVGEYTILDGDARPTFEFNGAGELFGSTYFCFDAFYGDEKEQDYLLDLDYKRILQGEFDYSRFRHWTGHDSLNIPWSSEDRDPRADYKSTRSLGNANLVFSPAQLPNLSFRVGYREEDRSGDRQALSVQSLFGPILSDSKEVDEVTRAYEAGITFRMGPLALENTFRYTDFESDESDGPFTGRGRPLTLVPEFDKYRNTLSARLDGLPLNTGLYTNYTFYHVDGTRETGLSNISPDIDYNSFAVKLTSVPLSKLTLGLAYRYQKVENDVHKWFDENLPSALDRDVNTFTFDSLYRIFRSTTLRYEFEAEEKNRDNELEGIHPEETERLSHRIAIQSRIPFAGRKLRLKAEYRRDDIDDPFSNLRYWYEARETGGYYPQLSQNPENADTVKLMFDIPLAAGLDLSLDGKWGAEEFKSKDGSSTQWDEDSFESSVTLSYTPFANLTSYLSYAYSQKDTDTRIATDTQFGPAGPSSFKSEYEEDVYSWIAGLYYQPLADLNLSGFITYSKHKAKYDNADLSGTAYASLTDLGRLSEHDLKTTELSLTCDYRITEKLFINAKFIYDDISDDSIYLYDNSGDGYMGIIGLTWKFI
ncbi:MAG: MtrB/PioB family outer membrane beta-barrel protein [Deltaproteobacteria bacterium]|nr:MtrB/PioB family outer membrane beta-barrel protein [Deltaproteobacteria bacterium]